MSIEDNNFQFLVRRYLKGTPARRAVANFKRWSRSELRSTLRPHDEETVSGVETDWRDEFDYLLSFYGVLEIAALIGFIPRQFERRFVETHLPILDDPAVRRYYGRHYPLALPGRFRRRLHGERRERLRPNRLSVPAYYAFLDLTAIIEDDDDVEPFLWFLDGGSRYDNVGEPEESIETLLPVLQTAEGFCELVTSTRARSPLLRSSALGFAKFIGFCRGFDALLNTVKRVPDLRAAFWQHHAYWLRRLRAEVGVGTHLRRALASIAAWEARDGSRAHRIAIRKLERVMNRLQVPVRFRSR